jgi:thiol-disulfide isomerase/thioredoxin
MTLLGRVQMPALTGATEWLNSEPLGRADLRGRVVLVNFWTLTCINWLRQAPFVRAWADAYRDDGLVVIGVHTPEFAFEHQIDIVQQAVRERGIAYPVVVDNDYAIWNAFANRAWPALYFVDADGRIRDMHLGEGRYEALETSLQRLLGVDRERVVVTPEGVEAQADWSNLGTPETYLGYWRDGQFASPGGAALDEPRDYRLPPTLDPDHWGLAGRWTVAAENIVLDRAGGSVAFNFHARDAHLVLCHGAHQPIPLRLRLDGEPPGADHGVDVDAAGDGLLRDCRMYQLIRQRGPVRRRTLEIEFLAADVEAYAFTFG